MPTKTGSKFRLGVIGGGQLARMMAPASQELGIDIRVLVEELGGSAEQVFKDTVVGEITLDTLRRIVYGLDGYEIQRTDVLTFEHEFVPNTIIKQIEGEGFEVQPNSSALQYAQNKILMRGKMDELSKNNSNIINPKYKIVKSITELTDFFRENSLEEAVIKAPEGGYDGKGVIFIKNSDSSEFSDDFIDNFTSMINNFGEVLVEEKVDFGFEVSVLLACSKTNIKPYPITQTISENGVCRTTITPAPELTAKECEIASRIGVQIASSLNVQGILAVEMFYKSGKFYINELAMRPHNTGHWTINGSVTSQFENHIRGVLDLPLGDTTSVAKYTVMQNILGSSRENLTEVLNDVLVLDSRLKVNLYGKGIRPKRKLGHINICGDNYEELIKTAKKASDLFENDK